MKTIGECFKQAINNNFRNTTIGRNSESVLNALNIGVKGSDNMCVLPKVEKVELTRIDDLHDKLSLTWNDYHTEGVVTWRLSTNKITKAMVFCGIEQKQNRIFLLL